MALDQSAAAVGLGQLQSLPFKNIIGGPLTAAIDAQALAAETTVRFIERIGFDIVNGQHHAVNLEFTYEDATGYFRRPAMLHRPAVFRPILRSAARACATRDEQKGLAK